jgi:hypothetical protein
MRASWTDVERWNWYAAGDETVAPRAVVVSVGANATGRVFFEMGLVFAVPLALAVFACLALPA